MAEVGDVLRERYRLTRTLGRGGMADVYLALDMERRSNVAVKVIREDLALEAEFVRRFRREAEVLRQLEHPHIVRFYSFETDGLIAFIVMDYVPGTTLQHRLAELKGPLPLDEAAEVMRQVGAALQYAHKRGYIHRDVKAANVMLRKDGTSLLSDFGLARVAGGAATSTSAPPIGTVPYMSPEQIKNQKLDSRSDIYSLGVLLFEMATGRRPFRGDQGVGVRLTDRVSDEHLHVPAPDPRSLNPNLPPAAAQVILRALAKERKDRWQDVGAFIAAWEEGLGLERSAPATVVLPAPQVGREGASGSMLPTLARCLRCGGAVQRDWSRCPHCGVPLGRGATGPLPTVPPGPPPTAPIKRRRPVPAPLLGVAGLVLCSAVVVAVATSLLTRDHAIGEPGPAATSTVRSTDTPAGTPMPTRMPSALPTTPVVEAVVWTASPTAAPLQVPTPMALPATAAPAATVPVPASTGTPTPTAPATPTATAPPSAAVATATLEATATPLPAGPVVLPAPMALLPEDGATVNTGAVLSWTPVKELTPDEYYLLRIVFPHGDTTWYDISWLKQTSWSVPGYFGLSHSTTGWYTWTVTVARQTGIDSNGKPTGEPIGVASEPRRFYCEGAPQPTTSSPGGSNPPAPPPTATLAPP
ncbi:MAG: serine/threonine-protein kinase [Anaerolineae bacterium]